MARASLLLTRPPALFSIILCVRPPARAPLLVHPLCTDPICTTAVPRRPRSAGAPRGGGRRRLCHGAPAAAAVGRAAQRGAPPGGAAGDRARERGRGRAVRRRQRGDAAGVGAAGHFVGRCACGCCLLACRRAPGVARVVRGEAPRSLCPCAARFRCRACTCGLAAACHRAATPWPRFLAAPCSVWAAGGWVESDLWGHPRAAAQPDKLVRAAGERRQGVQSAVSRRGWCVCVRVA